MSRQGSSHQAYRKRGLISNLNCAASLPKIDRGQILGVGVGGLRLYSFLRGACLGGWAEPTHTPSPHQRNCVWGRKKREKRGAGGGKVKLVI